MRPPNAAVDELPRPRIISTLSQKLTAGRAVGTIIGPEGYGKTVTAAQWVRHAGAHTVTAWLSLDPGDDEPDRFWSLLTSSFGFALGGAALPSPDVRDNAFLDTVLIQLSDVPGTVVLVLDGCHQLRNPSTLQNLDYLIHHAPENLRFLLVGRALPPVPELYKLHAAENVVEITRADLDFRRKEVALATKATPLNIDALLKSTEGWPAAVILALRHAAVGNTTPDAAGNDPLMEKLIEPLFTSYPRDVRWYMTVMSVLETFTAEDLTHAFVGAHGETLIETVRTQSGLLGSETVAGIKTYRLHRLLQQYLSTNADPELLPVRARMSRWYQQTGRHKDALRHAGRSQDPALLRSSVKNSGLPLLWAGEFTTLTALIDEIGPATSAELTLLKAQVAFLTGIMEPAKAWLQKCAAAADIPQLDPVFEALHHVLRAQISLAEGKTEEALRTLQQLPDAPDPDMDHFVTRIRASALLVLNRNEEARAEAEYAKALEIRNPNPVVVIDALSLTAAIDCTQELFRGAKENADQALLQAESAGLRYNARSRPARLVAAWCAYQQLSDAEAAYHNAFVGLGPTVAPAIGQSSAKLALILDWLQGDQSSDETALELLDRVRHDMSQEVPPWDVAINALQVSEMLLTLKRYDALHQLNLDLRRHQGITGELHIISAWRLLRTNRLEQARKLLAPVNKGFVQSQSALGQITGLALAAHIELEEERPFKAREYLLAALELGTRHGISRGLHFAGPLVRSALFRERHHFLAHEELIRTLERATTATPSAGTTLLTQRERQMLALLPTFATTQELANDLQISPNTVKTHIKGIYRKLGVTNRREAIKAAEHLGLLRRHRTPERRLLSKGASEHRFGAHGPSQNEHQVEL
ncbi:LuxR C-terminal-related transcriptional regulator [Paenarthrobacter sp. AMU7]|uniref:LuxR C-terminal-related transcriptional regulator n=1 Tax=Paenarthrobacter sp. AMU7 TaxID=3162492 RepID=A0AB39YP72_9MICC